MVIRDSLDIAVFTKQRPVTGAPLAVLGANLWTNHDLLCPIAREYHTKRRRIDMYMSMHKDMYVHVESLVQSKPRMKEIDECL